MEIPVTEFKAKCTRILREITSQPHIVKVTSRGKIIAVVSPPKPEKKPNPKDFIGSLKGSASYIGDIISPLENEWEADK